MSKSNRYSAEVRERAVRLVREQHSEYDSEWAAMESIAAKIGCTAETQRKWVRRPERAIRSAIRRVLGVMRRSASRSNGSIVSTSMFTALAKSGCSSSVRASPWRAARCAG